MAQRTGPAQPQPLTHSLSLKVMRLRKSDCYWGTQHYAEPSDLLKLDSRGYDCNLLTLPKDFGQIYVGDIFRSYISIHNSSALPVRNVMVRVELLLQKAEQLLDNSAHPIDLIAPLSNEDYIVEATLSESGEYKLVCGVSYLEENATELKHFKKIFKFPVHHPLGIKTVRIYTVREHIFIILELQNKMLTSLFIDLVKMETTPSFRLIDHSLLTDDTTAEEPMSVDEVRRFLFELAPTPAATSKHQLGKIEIRWRTAFGEMGHLVTNTIEHRQNEKPEVELSVEMCPNTVKAGEVFEVTLQANNNTDKERDLNLVVHPDKMFPLGYVGDSTIKLGRCPPNGTVSATIKLFAIHVGLQHVQGIEVKDLRTDKSYPNDLKTSLGVCLVRSE